MDPGDYPTNVLSCNNFATVNYIYYEAQAPFPPTVRKQLQRLEASWRQDGKLVHCDPYREGIWLFTLLATNTSSDSPTEPQIPSFTEGYGFRLSVKEKGTYEASSITKGKQTSPNHLVTPTSSSSPSYSLDVAVKNAQALNARAIHQNSSQGSLYEPTTSSPGIKTGNGPAETFPAQKDIYECLISAVLGTIVYRLCYGAGYVPLNLRTLILMPSKTIDSSTSVGADTTSGVILATLDISLTSLGTLVIKAYSDAAPGLQALLLRSPNRDGSTPALGTALWLAPGGTAAKYQGTSEEHSVTQLQSGSGDVRQNLMTTGTSRAWQSKCLEWLSTKGLDTSILEAGGWVLVQLLGGHPPYSRTEYQGIPILDDLNCFAWPALLCFQTSSFGLGSQSRLVNIPNPRDPLSFAESWFTGKDERANITLSRRKERQQAEAASKEQAEVEARSLQASTYSPMALRRGSVAGAMYPTPPDVLHHPIGATPSFDGAGSTPSNPSLFPVNDAGVIVPSNPPVHDMDSDMWGSSDKRDRNVSNTNFNDNDNDDMFGEMEGGDIFGTDITDADFSFFDEPDADDIIDQPSSPIPMRAPEQSIVADEVISQNLLPVQPKQPDLEMQDSDLNMLLDQHEVIVRSPAAVDAAKRCTNNEKDLETSSKEVIDPPFNKEVVFKRLFEGMNRNELHKQPKIASSFDKINFESSLASVNQKYSASGQFKFHPSRRRSSQVSELLVIPPTEFLSSRRKLKDQKQQTSLARILREDVPHQHNQSDPMEYLVDSDGSQVSVQDDISNTTDELLFSSNFDVAKAWNPDIDDRDRVVESPFDNLAMDFEQNASTPKSINGSQIPFLDADPADWSLTTYLTSIEPELHLDLLSDYERIATAQILADQAISGTLKIPSVVDNESSPQIRRACSTRQLVRSLMDVAKGCLIDVGTCTMRSFLDIQGIPVLNQTLRLPPRPVPPARGLSMTDALRANNPFNIPPPQIELRRSDATLSVLPAAVSFWENLGLSPSKGAKKVVAVCIYPTVEGIGLFANTFLDQMRSIYESSRLGTHERLTCKELTSGLLPFASEQHSSQSSLSEATGRLSQILSSYQVDEHNFVVYFVYPIDDAALLVHICSAFQRLFNMYRKSLLEKKKQPTNELVLQLIPMDFLLSTATVVVQSPKEYARLAMEVYDRCIDFSTSSSSPAIMLERPLPRNIDFKLTVSPSASLLQENTCLHIAYAQSIDGRWVTAIWTDNRGTQQMTASYCLGRKNEPLSMSFQDVANEIWETTLDFISNKKIHWRIMIARAGVMDPSEMEFWIGLAATENDAQISLTLITVQTDPSLRFIPNPVTMMPNGNAQSVITPVSTPQPSQSSIISPENASTPREAQNVATPVEVAAEPDNDARLIDYTDQSWGAVLSHRLNNSNSLLEVNPALISGYLIKRGGANIDDPPIVIEVNILHSEVVGNPRTFHESLLREILGYYRGLGTIARLRRIVDPLRDGRPWHIAAAEKATKALYMLM